VVRLALAFAFYQGAPGTIALFYAHLASLLVICGLCIRLLARNYDLSLLASGPGERHIWRETWFAGLSVMPSNLVARMFSDAPTLALNAMLPGAQGAIAGAQFALARKVSSIVQTIRLAFAYVLSPLASAASTGGKEAVATIYGFATRVSLAVALPVSLVLIAVGPLVLRAIGRGMETATLALALLLLARLAEAVTGAASPIQQVVSRYSSQYLGSIMGIIVAFGVGALLLPNAGLTGMSLAVALGLVATSAVPVWQLHRQDGVQPFAAPFGSTMLRATFISLIAFALSLLINPLPIWLGLPILITVLLASLWLSCRYSLPLHDRESLGSLGRRLRLI
jgi:O-antigen/teichoic acid export membrane protein